MLVKGKVWKEGNLWLSEVKHLDLLSQSKSKQGSMKLLLEQIEERYDFDKSFFSIHVISNTEFGITSKTVSAIVPLILKGLRNQHGLSIQDVATKLSFKSRSSYFKYETGERSISIDQFERIVEAISGNSIVFELNSSQHSK